MQPPVPYTRVCVENFCWHMRAGARTHIPVGLGIRYGMKKAIVVWIITISIGFVSAVGLCIDTLFAPKTVFSGEKQPLKIVLDAGHGGMDGGVVGKRTGIKESDLNLQIVYRLQEVFTDMGFEVVLTRKTEAGLYGTTGKGFKRRDMERRKAIIEAEKPSYVVSVHQNVYPSSSSRGAQVFFNAENAEGKALAECVQGELNGIYAQENAKGRKISKGDFYMLKCTPAPSILVECGFLSNGLDESLLITPAWQTQIAQAIGKGVMRFLSENAS